MVIKTPSILPGEPGWENLQKKKLISKNKNSFLGVRKSKKKTPDKIGNIILGDKAFRFGLPFKTHKGLTKYFVWRYKSKIGEIIISKAGEKNETIELTFNRLKSVGNYKALIHDVDFQKAWEKREQELLDTQKTCYLCHKSISKTAKPNLYHYNMFRKRSDILESSEEVTQEVVDGKLTIAEGWANFNDILEDGNRYYMSLKETALICASCAKKKNLDF